MESECYLYLLLRCYVFGTDSNARNQYKTGASLITFADWTTKQDVPSIVFTSFTDNISVSPGGGDTWVYLDLYLALIPLP